MKPDPTKPRTILRELEQAARKRFGQHFLTRRDLVERMVDGARLVPGDKVLEIGPGLGILTESLLQRDVQLKVLELDRDLVGWLRGVHTDLDLVEGDATKVDLEALCPGSGWKVVANLPYNVGTTVVMRILRTPQTFASATVMLQKEVVARLLGQPGTKAYGALSVEAQARARGVYVLPIPPAAFHPPPKVDSAVVRFELLDVPEVGDVTPQHFDRVVRAAFSQRRKTVANSLGSVFGKDLARSALASAGIEPRLRAEVLGMDAFRALAAALQEP